MDFSCLLHSNFAQIRKIAIFLILLRVLAICNCKTLNRSNGLFYPLIFYGMTRLCKLPNRSDKLFHLLTLDGLFTYYASYQIGQIDLFSGTQQLACYAKHQIGQIILNGFFAISKRLSDDHRHKLHNTKVLANIWSRWIDDLIFRYYSNLCFKAIEGRGSVGIIMIKLTRIVWCNEVDKRRAWIFYISKPLEVYSMRIRTLYLYLVGSSIFKGFQ